MLSFSKTYFTPDDVSVPCRIRRCEATSSLSSKHDEDADEDEDEQMMIKLQREEEILNQPEEMTCTMRTWHKTSTPPTSSEFLPRKTQQGQRRKSSDITKSATNQSSSSSSSGLPELILTHVYYKNMKTPYSCSSPNITEMNEGGLDMHNTDASNKPIPLSKRFESFGSSGQRSKSFGLIDNIMDQSRHQHFSISNGRSSSRQRGISCDVQPQQQQQSKEKIVISLDDIAKVHVNTNDNDNDDRDGKKNNKKNKRKSRNGSNTFTKNNGEQNHKRTIGITTTSSGWYYEFTMESMNEHLVLLTFLRINSSSKASLRGKTPKIEFVSLKKKKQTAADGQNYNENDRSNNNKDAIITHNTNDNNNNNNTNGVDDFVRSIKLNSSNLTQTSHQSNKSFDVETFTAKRMTERLKRESLSEKVERRMHRFVSSLEELSSSFTKCGCGCFGDSIITTAPATSSFDKNHSCPCRNTTTSTVSLSDDDEHNDNDKNNITANPSSRNSNNSNNNNATTKYELDDKNSNVVRIPVGGCGSNSSSSLKKKKQHREELMRYAQLPSGLSVESPDDYSEHSASLPSPRPVPLLTKP